MRPDNGAGLAAGQLPPFADPAEVVAQALEAARPPRRISPVEYAEARYRIPDGADWQPYSFERVPFMRRPVSLLDGRQYRGVVLQGPSQCTKSEIALLLAAWAEECDPADLLWLRGDKMAMQDFVIRRVNKALRIMPNLRQRQLQTASADNIFSKEFLGGIWAFAWPTETQLESRPVRRVVADDSDRIVMTLDGRETPEAWRGQLQARMTRFEGEEFSVEISTPSLGHGRGIEAQWELGTREVYQLPCTECGAGFEPRLDRDLHFERTANPGDARDSARLVCPDCGGIMDPSQKKALVAAGDWVGPQQKLKPGGRGVDGPPLQASLASFRINFAVALRSWGSVAERLRTAELAFEQRQDETDLRNVYNTVGGVNYRSKLAGAAPLKASELQARAEGYDLGQVPEWVQFLTAAVDVQGNRFAVMVMGWAEHFESCIVDRFDVLALEDGRTALDPPGKPEHWRVLLPQVMHRSYPIVGCHGAALPIVCTAIDTGGSPGVTPNAYKFWHLARAAGVARSGIMLVKGGNKPKAALLPMPSFVEQKRGKPNRLGPQLWTPNVNGLKDVVDVRLRRKEPGPGYIHLPRDIDPAHLAELTAETRNADGQWERDPGVANETLDLAVYNTAVVLRFVGNRADLAGVPSWAQRATVLKETAAGRPARVPAGAAAPAGTPEATPRPASGGRLADRFRRLNGG
ncbi:MAG: phage terminase large subunit family protein [Kiloniellaceae bacterium]